MRHVRPSHAEGGSIPRDTEPSKGMPYLRGKCQIVTRNFAAATGLPTHALSALAPGSQKLCQSGI